MLGSASSSLIAAFVLKCSLVWSPAKSDPQLLQCCVPERLWVIACLLLQQKPVLHGVTRPVLSPVLRALQSSTSASLFKPNLAAGKTC